MTSPRGPEEHRSAAKPRSAAEPQQVAEPRHAVRARHRAGALRRAQTLRATAALAVLLLTVTACARDDRPEASPSQAPTATSTTSPSAPVPQDTAAPGTDPSATPGQGTDSTPPAELVVSTSGLGPLTVGVPPASNPGAALIRFDEAACAGEDQPVDPAVTGRWISTLEPFTDADGEQRPRFAVAADDAAVAWIDVVDPTLRTAAGIGIGSTLTAVQAAYPALVEGTPGPTSRVWWVQDAAGSLVVETQDDADGLQPPGTPPTVILMRVLAPGIDPDFTTANSDNVAGGCL